MKKLIVFIFCLAFPSFVFASYQFDRTGAQIDAILDRASNPTLVVAASDTPAALAAGADYTCDGTNDDATINTVITALPSAGGIVELLIGTYYVGDNDEDTFGICINKDNVVLVGAGNATVIKPESGHGSSLSLIYVGPNNQHISIKDIKLDGDSANFAGGGENGIRVNGVDYLLIENVTAVDGGGTDGHAILAESSDYMQIVGFREGSFYTNSIEIRSSNYSTVSNCTLTQNVEVYSTAKNLSLLNSVLYDATATIFTYADSEVGENLLISGCQFYTVTGSNVCLTIQNSKDSTITGNYFYGDATSLNIIQGTVASQNVTVTNNIFKEAQLSISGNIVGGLISGNMFSDVISFGNAIDESGGFSPTDWVIQNNFFSGSTGNYSFGIKLDGVTRWIIRNNYFKNFTKANYGAIDLGDEALTGCFIDGNEAENCNMMFDLTGPPTGTIRFGDNFIEQEAYIKTLGAGTGQTVWVFPQTELTSNGDAAAETGTLGDGAYKGQEIWITMATDGGDAWEVTITNHVTSDPEVATFDDAGDYLHLRWTGSEWMTIANTCTF